MKIEALYTLYKQSYLVDTDTRNIRKGSIFFALSGERFNGNMFASEALEKGAKYCIIDDEAYYENEHTILVDNSLKTLQELANFHRNQLTIPIIALTGSNGKTTTKELINAVLSKEYQTTATQGNLNNHIGVPLTLLSINDQTEIGIIEMGANHQKEIEFLSSIAEPDYGYITNFGKAHLEGFGGVEGVIKGKSELYQYLQKNEKVAFVNSMDGKQMELTQNINRILLNHQTTKLTTTDPFLRLEYHGFTIKTNLVGEYNFINIIAAISIGEHFKVAKQHIIKAIENYTPKNNRSQIVNTTHNKILLDAYNANPSSVELALLNFHKSKHPNKVVILGDMFELGTDAEKEHQSIVDLSSQLGFTEAFFVGENFYKTSAENKFMSIDKLITVLKSSPLKDSFILIKGSRGMTLEKLVEFIN